jgi:hypothetical protein
MAVDIPKQLNAMLQEREGEVVASNIASAAETISETDISPELNTIRSSIYGRQMRQAIHDALLKLSMSSGGEGSGMACLVGRMTSFMTGSIISVPYLCGEIEQEG